MPSRANHQALYERSPHGVLVPVGSLSDFTSSSAVRFDEVRSRALEIEELFAENGLELGQHSSLRKLIADAVRLSDDCERGAGLTRFADLFGALQVERIASAVLPLRVLPGRAVHLRKLHRGTLDLLSRTPSEAKASLWELELWANFQRMGIDAVLAEPDIVVKVSAAQVGIACKRIFSEANVEKTLSKAVAQIERGFAFGGVALNLDDLVPPDSICRGATHEEICTILRTQISQFTARHQAPMRKYLSTGRAMFALVSLGAIGNTTDENPAFNNFRQTVGWIMPGLPEEKSAQVNKLILAFDSAHRAE